MASANPPQGSPFDPNNVQGDIVLGLQKRFQTFLFFAIDDVSGFKHVLKSGLIPLVTTTQGVINNSTNISAARTAAGGNVWLPFTDTNISFSYKGLAKLGIDLSSFPASSPFAQKRAFATGQAADAIANLGDPVDAANPSKLTTWKDAFLKNEIHGLIMVTAASKSAVDHKVDHIEAILGKSVSFVEEITGNVRPGAEAGHEHFGFADGLTTPAIEGFNNSASTVKSGTVDRSLILTGYDSNTATAPSWVKDGSFLVFRELEQLVPEFDEFLAKSADPLNGITADFLGARIVGRWKSGAPIDLAPLQDDTALAADKVRRQDFDFSDDPKEEKCPYVAHIRKTNPREGLGPNTQVKAVLPHLMIRQGIPFGPEVDRCERIIHKTRHARGLLFVCYQSAIESGFQFVQRLWSNNAQFPPNALGIAAPGNDLIIGQVQTGNHSRSAQGIDPKGTGNLTAPSFVTPRGGEYFFAPSLSALKNTLSA